MSQNVRIIPLHTCGGPDNGPVERVETGAVQFGNDYPGLFIRGDNAAYLAFCISQMDELIQGKPELADDLSVFMYWSYIKGIASTVHKDVIVKPKS